MEILVRAFNDSINSKTGNPLPQQAPRRGTPHWKQFEDILFEELSKHSLLTIQPENPTVADLNQNFERTVYVHKTKRDNPFGSLFYMQMHLSKLFTVDMNGWGVEHSRAIPEEFANLDEDAIHWVENLSDELWANNESKLKQPTITNCDINVPFVLVPVQIPRDYTIQWHSPITVKYFIDSVQAWAHQSQTHIAFKLHPCNQYDYEIIEAIDEAVRYSRYCHKVDGNIHELIKRSAGLFVINSGTGFESLIHGKPVCTFGDADYQQVTFNADIRRIDEARNFIFDYSESMQRIARKFIYWYIHKHAFYLDDPAMKTNLEEFINRWINN